MYTLCLLSASPLQVPYLIVVRIEATLKIAKIRCTVAVRFWPVSAGRHWQVRVDFGQPRPATVDLCLARHEGELIRITIYPGVDTENTYGTCCAMESPLR